MKCCYQVFKLTVVIVNLVSLGTGFTKFYKLFSDIGSAIKDIGDTKTFEDLKWLPYLIVHISSTIGIVMIVYCLIRELCEDSYMFKHCFKSCFIITMLIYFLSVFPKSVMNIVYHSFDVSLDDWFSILADALDSLLAGLGVLGFQVILYMKVITKIFRSAGACKGSTVGPDNVNVDGSREPDSSGGCCIVLCCSRNKANNQKQDDVKEIETEKKSPKGLSQSKVLYYKGSNVIKKATSKVKAINEKVENKKKQVTSRIKSEVDKRKTAIKDKAQKKGNALKSKVSRNKTYVCNDCENLELEIYELENSDTNKTKPNSKVHHVDTGNNGNVCAICGQENNAGAEDPDTNNQSESQRGACCELSTCSKCKSCCCSLLNNRTKCFVVTMVLANIHMFVYMAELVLVLCVVC